MNPSVNCVVPTLTPLNVRSGTGTTSGDAINRSIGFAPGSAQVLGFGAVGSKIVLPIVITIGITTASMVEPDNVDANGLVPTMVPVRGFFSLSFVTEIEYVDNGMVWPPLAARIALSVLPPLHGRD